MTTTPLSDSSEPATILIVDDTPANLQLLAAMLKERGYKPRPVRSGTLALQAARAEPPDLILLDVNMPGMDGYQVCEHLKADDRLRAIPVLFISALTETLDKVRGFQVGGVDYLTKPFQIEEVDARVQTHLKLHRLQRELEGANAHLEETVRLRTRQLAEANQHLAALDKAKSDFLSLISHELRTPLNGLFGIADLLLTESPATPVLAMYRDLFEQSRRRIVTLLEDALLLTQIEVSAESFQSTFSPLNRVLDTASANVLDFARSREVRLDLAAAGPDRVMGGTDLLARALQSLLETAVKFALPGGAIRLTITPAAAAIHLAIEASGRAIPAAVMPRFFDVLAIGETIVPGGDLGLGPALAQRIISIFGGAVSIENLEPPGIRLHVRLKTAT